MTIKSTLFLFFLCCLLSACSTSINKKLSGTWKMTTVYDNASDVTAQHNPEQDRWITFNKDGSFKSGGQPYGKNGGKWTYHPSENILYLDSDEGEGDDSFWVLQVDKKSMSWAGARSSFTERFKISFYKD